jgi:hypothetical protein
LSLLWCTKQWFGRNYRKRLHGSYWQNGAKE